MRLWHEELLNKLPRQQLIGQHRELCALRGNGYEQNHSTVNYVWEYSKERLIAFHLKVMKEMENRGYNPSPEWYNLKYRGKNCDNWNDVDERKVYYYQKNKCYPEHNDKYLRECVDNLFEKNCICRFLEGVDINE